MSHSRYVRHLSLPGFGESEQQKLEQAAILVIGAGGLGCPALQYLAAAGIGRIRIVDPDTVDESNLQRQTLYSPADVGSSKALAAAKRIQEQNPLIVVEAVEQYFDASTAFELLDGCSIVLDGSDNFATRYVVNDACVLKGIPLVFGSVFQYDGQLAVFNYLRPDGSRGPNYRDLFPEPPPYGSVPDCAEGGVLGVLPGIIGTMQALEAIKLITGLGDLLDGKILTFDALSFQTKTLSYSCDPNNPLTGIRPMQTELIDYDLFCGVPRNISTILRNEIPTLEPCDWDRWRNVHTQFLLIDVREEKEYYRESMNGQLIPLGEIPHRISEIDFSLPILVHCQSGKRSEQAVKQLIQLRPEAQIWNLAGGIIAWYHLRSELVNWDSGS